ncbi:MAG: radical SAM protein [Pseudomonadota bacterium]
MVAPASKDKFSGNVVIGKFEHPDLTVQGEVRASVYLDRLETLWINTGTLCNIECLNCYIESSPKNDRLVYFSVDDAKDLFDEIEDLQLGTEEIGFTGGEPFLNPDMLKMMQQAGQRGFQILVLTNAMIPMQRPHIKEGLLELQQLYPKQITFRVSLDHYSQELHEQERGLNTWRSAISGMNWLSEHNFKIAIAGRTCWGEDDEQSRAGYSDLIAEHNWNIDPDDHSTLVLFPEVREQDEVPEITTECWDILNVNPSDMMCANSRMVVKRKGADKPAVLPCTLLPYDTRFEMGASLAESLKADGGLFDDGAVKLCHPYCSKFCVLGGGSCSG